jgi:hypothetical protein
MSPYVVVFDGIVLALQHQQIMDAVVIEAEELARGTKEAVFLCPSCYKQR